MCYYTVVYSCKLFVWLHLCTIVRCLNLLQHGVLTLFFFLFKFYIIQFVFHFTSCKPWCWKTVFDFMSKYYFSELYIFLCVCKFPSIWFLHLNLLSSHLQTIVSCISNCVGSCILSGLCYKFSIWYLVGEKKQWWSVILMNIIFMSILWQGDVLAFKSPWTIWNWFRLWIHDWRPSDSAEATLDYGAHRLDGCKYPSVHWSFYPRPLPMVVVHFVRPISSIFSYPLAYCIELYCGVLFPQTIA